MLNERNVKVILNIVVEHLVEMLVRRLATRVLCDPAKVSGDAIHVRINGKVCAVERKQQRAGNGLGPHSLEREQVPLDLIRALRSQPLKRAGAVLGVERVENRLDPSCLGIREAANANGLGHVLHICGADGVPVRERFLQRRKRPDGRLVRRVLR